MDFQLPPGNDLDLFRVVLLPLDIPQFNRVGLGLMLFKPSRYNRCFHSESK
jgi:hypothetical protein